VSEGFAPLFGLRVEFVDASARKRATDRDDVVVRLVLALKASEGLRLILL
jgi:hypothetical protein